MACDRVRKHPSVTTVWYNPFKLNNLHHLQEVI